MDTDNVELRLRQLDGRLETGGISLEDYLKALHVLIGEVLETQDEDVITTLALHLAPAQSGVGNR